MKKIILTIGGVLALMLGGITASTASASTAEPVEPSATNLKIVKVGTDAMGTDTYANRNREYVTFKNVSTTDSVDIAGVLVEDNWAHGRTLRGIPHSCNTYAISKLPGQDGAVLAPGESVTVFNGQRFGGAYKTGSEYRLYANSDVDCGTAGHFFNNDADTAWVTKSNGDVLDSQSWDWNGGYYVYARR
jgi:hypothetical protein